MSNLLGNGQRNVKTEFDAACVDVFRSPMRRSMLAVPGKDLLPRFAQHYQHLLALPRRARRSLQRQWKRTLGGVALLLALTPGAAFAATMNVAAGVAPDVNADGKCSLNEAIFNANNNRAMHPDCPAGSGTDTIILPVGSKQVLTNSVGPLPGSKYYAQGVPKIRSAIVIEGRGSTIERADGSPIDVMMVVETNGDLTLNETIVSGRPAAASTYHNDAVCMLNRGKLTFTKGSLLRGYNANPFYDFGYSSGGSGLRNEGTATLSNSTVAQNYGNRGSGIYNAANATLLVSDSVVSNNLAHSDLASDLLAVGAGIHNRGALTVRNSSISGNRTDAIGMAGGIWNDGTLTVDNSVVSGNVAWIGGGIVNWGTATISRSTIADNEAEGAFSPDYYLALGGGVFTGGTTTIVNSTISGNQVKGYGGGISAYSGTLTLSHTTVTSNRANPVPWEEFDTAPIGGGISVETAAIVRIERSLISGNQSQGKGPEVGIVPGTTPTILANNFNVFGASGKSDVQGFAPGPTDIVPAVATTGILMPLANNGGKGATHALAINSPALNAAPIDPKCPATDQRGNPRPQGVKCDIGSFEGSAVLCNGLVTTQVGTNLADTLTGTAGRDIIAGIAGNDTIRGLNGNDVICAGSGADKVYGGNNNDLLFGDSENDQLYGDAGNDALNGGTGTDKCNGGSGTDTATQCETRTSVP